MLFLLWFADHSMKYAIFCGERNNFSVFAVIYHP